IRRPPLALPLVRGSAIAIASVIPQPAAISTMLAKFTAIIAAAACVCSASHVHVKVHHHHHKVVDAASWQMTPVVGIHARVQGDMPVWDNTTNSFVSKYGETADDHYYLALDTVNTASPEGALFYVQAEMINKQQQTEKCKRKNGVNYVVFYNTTIVQPVPSLAANKDYLYGLDGEKKLGTCVGASKQEAAKRGPYPGNYWYSFPGGCADKKRDNKTAECREEHATGMCPRGVTPDGKQCTFSYEILGYIAIDDIVGITAMKNEKTGKNYGNFTEFCEAGNIEFDAKLENDEFKNVQSIDFWKNPGDQDANKKRFETMVKVYNEKAGVKDSHMKPLPTVSDLANKNPPCYKNSAACAGAAHGCRRVLYTQMCEVCHEESQDCVKVPADFSFPAISQRAAACGEHDDSKSPATDASSPPCQGHFRTPPIGTAWRFTMLRLWGSFSACCVILASVRAPVAGAFEVKPIRTIHARVQDWAPVWDEDHQAFAASQFGGNFNEKYVSGMDSVNTASVEGALMYVQAEGINQNEQSVPCERKNKMAYVVFSEVWIAQPTTAFGTIGQEGAALPEYCPFLALDGGKCTPENGNQLPRACKELVGLEGERTIGACIGGEARHSDARAPYPNTVWFSFPNSCVMKGWKEKTADCRSQYPGGLCPIGTKPNGLNCTYSYSVLGYVAIDDIVGITSIKKNDSEATYANYTEFCLDGNVEFKATKENKVEKSLPFWENPGDPAANAKRAQHMIEVYNSHLQPHMIKLPTIEELRAGNPPCSDTTPVCAKSEFGCKRNLYSQVCELCTAQSDECVKGNVSIVFPTSPPASNTSRSNTPTPSNQSAKPSATPIGNDSSRAGPLNGDKKSGRTGSGSASTEEDTAPDRQVNDRNTRPNTDNGLTFEDLDTQPPSKAPSSGRGKQTRGSSSLDAKAQSTNGAPQLGSWHSMAILAQAMFVMAQMF
ncbi:TPA: hypothetical protein N0F65_010386, partial [Lagenidium giganteum]